MFQATPINNRNRREVGGGGGGDGAVVSSQVGIIGICSTLQLTHGYTTTKYITSCYTATAHRTLLSPPPPPHLH